MKGFQQRYELKSGQNSLNSMYAFIHKNDHRIEKLLLLNPVLCLAFLRFKLKRR